MKKIGKLLKKIVCLSGCMSVCVSVITNEKKLEIFLENEKNWKSFQKIIPNRRKRKKTGNLLENEKYWKSLQNDGLLYIHGITWVRYVPYLVIERGEQASTFFLEEARELLFEGQKVVVALVVDSEVRGTTPLS